MDVLVDNQMLMVDGDEFGHPDSSAVLSWSLRHFDDRRLAQVTTPQGGADAAIIAFDLRIELLDDSMSLELTRGMEIDVVDYFSLQGPPVPLRTKAAGILRLRALDHALSLPK